MNMIEKGPARAEGEHAERKRGEQMDSEHSVESTLRLAGLCKSAAAVGSKQARRGDRTLYDRPRARKLKKIYLTDRVFGYII